MMLFRAACAVAALCWIVSMAGPSGDDVHISAGSQLASIIDQFDTHLAPRINITVARALFRASKRFRPLASKIMAFRSLFDPLTPNGTFPDLFAQCRTMDVPAIDAIDAGEFLLHRQIVFINRLLDHHDAIRNLNRALERAVVNWGIPGGVVLGTVLRHVTDSFHFTAGHRQAAADALEHLLRCNVRFSDYGDDRDVVDKGLEHLDRADPSNEEFGGERYDDDRYDDDDDITKRALHLVEENAPEHARFVRLAVSRRVWKVVDALGVRFLRFFVEHGGDINAVRQFWDNRSRINVLLDVLQDRNSLVYVVNLGVDALRWFQDHWEGAYERCPDPKPTLASVVAQLMHEFDAMALTRIIYTQSVQHWRGPDTQDIGWLESIFNTVISSTMSAATFSRRASRWIALEQMPIADVIFLIKHRGAEIVDDVNVKWVKHPLLLDKSNFVLHVVMSRESHPILDALIANAGRPAVSRLQKNHSGKKVRHHDPDALRDVDNSPRRVRAAPPQSRFRYLPPLYTAFLRTRARNQQHHHRARREKTANVIVTSDDSGCSQSHQPNVLQK